MVELKFVDVIGFRTEDPKFPTANLLRGQKWLSEKNWGSSVNDVTLRLEKVDVISAIDVGNFGTAFITVEVSRVGLDRYQILLPSSSLMTAEDCKTKENWSCVKMFTEDDFIPEVGEQKWDLVRVVCMQPFIRNVQFGLSFFKIFSSLKKVVEQVDLNECVTSKSSILVRRPENYVVAIAKPLSRSEKLVEEVIKNNVSPVHQKINVQNRSSPSSNSRVETKLDSDQENVSSVSFQVKSPNQISGSIGRSARKKISLPHSLRHEDDQKDHSSSARVVAESKVSFRISGGESVSRKTRGVKSALQRESMESPRRGSGRKVTKQKKANLEVLNSEVEEVICIASDSDSDLGVALVEEATTPKLKKKKEKRKSWPFEKCSPAILMKKERTSDDDATAPSPSNSISSDVTDILLNDDYYGSTSDDTKATCPICSEEFLVSEIEGHASCCGLIEEPDVMTCPICDRHFPPQILQQHADVCVARNANL